MTSQLSTPSTTNQPDIFQRGTFGEILCPPLIAGVDPDEALNRYIADNNALGANLKRPTRGHALEGAYNSALLYHHLLRLRQVLAGNGQTKEERALYEAVVQRGEPLSLRLPSLEGLKFISFVPVLQTLTPRTNGDQSPMQWQIGLPSQGKVETFTEAEIEAAVKRAQQIYVAWSNEDAQAFDMQAKTALAATLPSLFHDYWLFHLEESNNWDRGGGFRLTLLGRHNTMQFDWPEGMRIIETDRERAVRLCDALARQADVKADYPTAEVVLAWLVEQGADSSAQMKWGKGKKGLPAKVQHGDREYALVERGNTVVLYTVEIGQYKRRVAGTGIEGPISTWLDTGDETGRKALVTWAFWKDATSKDKR